jgi:hypothetical protein
MAGNERKKQSIGGNLKRHVGFSGTRAGMTSSQIYKVDSLLDDDIITQIAHHGDCIGADEDFHKLAILQGLYIIGHPPLKEKLRANCQFDELRDPKGYVERDHDIVDESDWLIFTPLKYIEILRSGTWATIRYAKKKNKQGFIVWPDGTLITLEEWESVLL